MSDQSLFSSDAYLIGGDAWTLCLGSCLDEVYGLSSLPEQSVDLLLADPPYGKRTHEGQQHERAKQSSGDAQLLSSNGLGYEYLLPEDVALLCEQYVRVVRGWILVMTSHDLFPVWENELGSHGHYVFAPVPIVIPAMNVRLQGDGPSGWSVWLVVARPRRKQDWGGTKQGAYWCHETKRDARVKGSKPLGLMETLVRDYSKRGQTILDTHTGSGTTGVAALKHGRSFIGYELAPQNFDVAKKNLGKTRFQGDFFEHGAPPPKQLRLVDDGKPKNEVDERIFAKIADAGPDGLLTIELTESVNLTRPQLRSALGRLVKVGRVRCEGSTVKRRYFCIETIPSQTIEDSSQQEQRS